MGKKRVKETFNDNAGESDQLRLSELRPTQMTVGLREVEYKRGKLKKLAKDPAALKAYLDKRPISVVLGPKNKFYVIDHHHLALAMIGENYKTAVYKQEHDFSQLPKADFWQKMQELKLVYLGDENGKQKTIADLPEKLTEMKDDPYRSIAGLVRREGGFENLPIPYMEFAWADYFRAKIDEETVKKNFAKAVKTGVKLAADPAAAHLPGYKGLAPAQQPKP